MAGVRLIVRAVRLLTIALLVAVPASAQTVSAGVEAARDRFTYHFDNPSSFDTAQLVPHFFEQTYVADNVWLIASLQYTAGVRWETSGGATPTRTLPATDFDTFFDPAGTVIVSGTTGDADIHSFRVTQRAELGRAGPIAFDAGYSIRYDAANFLVGHKTVSRNGAVVQAFDVTSREMTSSLTQEFFVGASVQRDIGAAWRVTIGGDATPLLTGRLTVELPDKYPGESFVFGANSLSAACRLALSTRGARHAVALSIAADRAWHYASANSFTRERVWTSVTIGL